MALAQTQVSGKVTSAEDGEPVIGASIKVVGTKTGAVTDIEGNFIDRSRRSKTGDFIYWYEFPNC